MPRRWARLWLVLITAGGGVFRFYNLGWGAPYHHFHIDEHFVFSGADLLRHSAREAAMSPKFFMYSPLPMHMLNVLVWVYEHVGAPLVLTVPRDEVTYTVLGRTISATLSTATIPLIYFIGHRLAGRAAGLVGAALLASSVLSFREAHFFSVDSSLTFFAVLAWAASVTFVQRPGAAANLGAGAALAGALLCKYTGIFLVPVVGLAHLLSLPSLKKPRPDVGWMRWVARASAPFALGALLFLALDWMVIAYFQKFRQDIAAWVTEPMSGASRPIWAAQFVDVEPYSYWFTNILFWGIGPAFEIWAIAGVIWLLWRRDRAALVGAAFPVAYYLTASRSITPFARYGVPLIPALALSAGVLSADLLRRATWRRPGAVATAIVVGSTALYGLAYMNVFRAPDSRLQASRFLLRNVPRDARILVEPSHNIPPMGSYLRSPSFYDDYVMWGPNHARDDYYRLRTLDTYQFLYRPIPAEEKRAYIARRLDMVDYIVMDDTFVQFYQHLPAAAHGVVKQYYDDLFNGRLGFERMQTFKVYPQLLGYRLNDDRAELSFRLFDHPAVFIFTRIRPLSSGKVSATPASSVRNGSR